MFHLTGKKSVRILQVHHAAEAGQSVVGDLQNETAVHHTVAGLEVPVGHNDAVVHEEHSLEEKETANPAGQNKDIKYITFITFISNEVLCPLSALCNCCPPTVRFYGSCLHCVPAVLPQ